MGTGRTQAQANKHTQTIIIHAHEFLVSVHRFLGQSGIRGQEPNKWNKRELIDGMHPPLSP